MLEDDKDLQQLNELKTMRVRSEGYDVPRERTISTGSGGAWQEQEQDIAYHNRYGAEEETHGPLESDERRDMGFHNHLL